MSVMTITMPSDVRKNSLRWLKRNVEAKVR